MAPTYIIIAGKNPNEGAIITRDREKEAGKRQKLNDVNQTLVQTNIDSWSENPNENILWSIERRKLAKKLIYQIKEKNGEITMKDLWKIMLKEPIANIEIIYRVGMSAAHQEYESKKRI